jgi:hypothetical protein
MPSTPSLPSKVTLSGFFSEFLERHKKLPDRPFCWILGSGASTQSGIPTGGKLAIQWLKEMHQRENFDGLSFEAWGTAKNLGIQGFNLKNAASFYPFIYQRRFKDFKEMGYAFLEDAMDKSDPSYGYSVLAQIMTSTRHRIAITTNFDNLIADAVSIYTRTFPLVCGHELLTGFIRPGSNRPVIAKVHRDLLFNPKSTPEEIHKLPPEWEDALSAIFQNNTPIVIGYGGNDGSLMGYLKKIAPIKGGIFWCHRKDHEPGPAIQEVVAHHHGCLVPIEGFDELMLRFETKLDLPSPLLKLKEAHEFRVAAMTKQLTELEDCLKKIEEGEKLVADVRSKMEPWKQISDGLADMAGILLLNHKIKEANTLEKQEAVFREAAQSKAEKPWFWSAFADFLWKRKGNKHEANDCFRKAIELNPDEVGEQNYAEFLKENPQFNK